MNKLRIGMVTLCYRPTINGVVQMIDLYRERFEALGHEVTIFTLGEQNAVDSNVVSSRGVPLGKSGYYVNFRLDKYAQAQMAQMDILHCHHLFITMWLARRYGRCPVVYTNHTRYDLYAHNILSLPQRVADGLMTAYWPMACQQADTIIAPSASLHQMLAQMKIKRPIVTIENGIAQRPFLAPTQPITKADLGLPDTAVLLIYVGRLSKEKNLSQLFKQFRKVVQCLPEIHLLLVGDGPERERLQKVAQIEQISECLTFCGAVPHQTVPNYLASADLFVTASMSEVHPLTLLEAMAVGIPIVAPNAPGNRDIVVHQETGLLVDDVDCLAREIQQLLADSTKRQMMSQRAKQRSQQFTINETVQKTLDLYQNLMIQFPTRNQMGKNGRLSARLWAKMVPKRSL